MKVCVLKFGGTSVATAEARQSAANRVISCKEAGYAPVVVVSAMGRRGEPYATDTLIDSLNSIDAQVRPDPRELDMMMACGEIFSAVIFAQTLTAKGAKAFSLRGGQAGIRTDGVYGNARITAINPITIQSLVDDGVIPVICGFQGVYVGPDRPPGAELTTLGRGGSDTTAAAVAAALKASAVFIYTDVDGIKVADPRLIHSAPTLRQVTYEEVAELAHLGAKVVHPRAAEIAMKFGVPLWIKNTFSDDSGSEVTPASNAPTRSFTGVTHSGKLVHTLLQFSEVDSSLKLEIERRILEVLSQLEFSLFMLSRTNDSFSFAFPRSRLSEFVTLFDGRILECGNIRAVLRIGDRSSNAVRVQQTLLGRLSDLATIPIHLTDGCTMISLVGQTMMKQHGLYARVLRSLTQCGVPVLQTSDSDFSLSCLIPESEADRSIRALYTEFELQSLT